MIVDEVTDDDLSLDPKFRNNNTVENTITANRRVTRHMSTSKEDSRITMLENTEGSKIPRRMKNVVYYFSNVDSI